MIGLTHVVSPDINRCELTFIDREPIAYDLAVQQHDNYCALLRSCGVNVVTLSENISHPDCCFIEDTAIVVDEIAVIASMGAASRRDEIPAIEKELSKYRELAHIRPPATIEGGDVLQIGKRLFAGISSRTNIQGVEQLAQILGPLSYSVIPVQVKGSLHLKTACTAINNETLLVNPRWIDLEPLRGFNLVFTPDPEPWAANTLRIGDTVYLQSAFPRTLELVQKLNVKAETIDISQLSKAEAGLTCLSITFKE